MHSLRSRLLAVWIVSLLVAGVVGVVLVGLYRQSAGAQEQRARDAVADACAAIVDRFTYYAAGWAGPLPESGSAEAAAFGRDLAAVLDAALGERPGIEGGIWRAGATAPLAGGGGEGLRDSIAALAALAGDEQVASARLLDGGDSVLLTACRIPAPVGLAAYALARIPETPGQNRLLFGVGALLALVLAMTVLLGWAALFWSRRLGAIVDALGGRGLAALPRLALSGERDLDRIVTALNEAAGLAGRIAQAERFAALGRVAAGVAHEVRNPVAAMRLRAENALAGDDARRRAALEAILGHVARLERLTGELLTMTQKRIPAPVPTDLRALLTACAADHGATIDVAAPEAVVMLDPELLRRALDELLRNAVRHSPPEGRIALAAALSGGGAVITVRDQGPGVDEALRETLFEPFVTGRPDGTGLGLAIAREMVEAMGGRLDLETSPTGAHFRIEVPCPRS